MRRRLTSLLLLTVAVAAAAAGCGSTSTTLTEPGGVKGQEPPGSIPTATRAPGTSAVPAIEVPLGSTAGRPGAEPGSTPPSPPTTCVSVPASTAPGGRGGGELICSSPGDSGAPPASSPMTTVPSDAAGNPLPAMPSPDATHGVVVVSTGGSPCPASAQQCVAMYAIVPATVTFTPPDGQAVPPVAIVSTGRTGVLLSPGAWQVAATPSAGNRTCAPQPVTVTAGATVEISIDCALPG